MTNCREKNVAVQDVVDNKVARRVDYVVREINRLRVGGAVLCRVGGEVIAEDQVQ